MQSVDQNGILGELQKFDPKEMAEMLKNPNIDHVDVFEGTKENIEHRKSLVGKKFKYKVSRGFKKARSIKTKKR